VRENPEWDALPFNSRFRADYGEFESLADVFRQISYDERVHKQESEAELEHARFR
jgi:rubrerythrin